MRRTPSRRTTSVLYRNAGRVFHVPPRAPAATGALEPAPGRPPARGVRSGVNDAGCCAGPMQTTLHDGPASPWERFRVDGDGDGPADPYHPGDAIATAAHYLRALLA